MGFRVLVAGSSGQVGSGLVRALLAASSCTEVVMVNRRTILLAPDARLREVIMDTSAAEFSGEIAEVARTCSALVTPCMPHHALASAKGVSNGAKRTLRGWKLAWSARLRVAASRRESKHSDFFRQPGAALRAGFVMRASWAKKKIRCGRSDLSV
jgi:hypothetical protein